MHIDRQQTENGKTVDCQFIHAAFDDDWGRCPYPDQVREYKLPDGTSAWYCYEGAYEAGLIDWQDYLAKS
jgi:hypothetical protein